jgi:hypothetical protein
MAAAEVNETVKCPICQTEFKIHDIEWDTEHQCCLCGYTVCDKCIKDEEEIDGEGCVCIVCGNPKSVTDTFAIDYYAKSDKLLPLPSTFISTNTTAITTVANTNNNFSPPADAIKYDDKKHDKKDAKK